MKKEVNPWHHIQDVESRGGLTVKVKGDAFEAEQVTLTTAGVWVQVFEFQRYFYPWDQIVNIEDFDSSDEEK